MACASTLKGEFKFGILPKGLWPQAKKSRADQIFLKCLRFGAVKDVIVKMDPNTQQSRGFGFVLFMNEASIDAVVNGGPHNLDGKRVSI